MELYTETDKLIAENDKIIAELRRRLTSEQAAAATAVELHDRTKAVVVVKKEKVEGLEDASKCKVCFEQEANVICHPCSHVSTCEACFAGLAPGRVEGESVMKKRCPMCRGLVNSHGRIYL